MKADLRSLDLEQIQIGDFAAFTRTLGPGEVGAFADLVGDVSPLHVDSSYGRETTFGANLVHGMLLASHFSTLVGTLLPGKTALLTSMTTEFVAPVPVGSEVTFSASVTAISHGAYAISLRLLAYQSGRVCVRGKALVEIRSGVP
jgi:3-hydroxybutyryl-CoA dehydratase